MYLIRIITSALFVVAVIAPNPLSFLSQIFENYSKLKFERAEIVSWDDSILKYCELATFKINENDTALNITLEFKQDLKNDIDVVFQAYKFFCYDYYYYPVWYRTNICDAYNENVMGVQSAMECGNFSGCPVKKNRIYHVCNFQPDGSNVPFIIPTGSYMAKISFVANTFGTDPFMTWKCYSAVA